MGSQFTLEAMAHATLVQMTKPLKCVALVQVNMVIFPREVSTERTSYLSQIRNLPALIKEKSQVL